jgi:hypothetical protein
MPTVLKSGSLNLLEPYGPVQACNGIALPLPYSVPILRHVSGLLVAHHQDVTMYMQQLVRVVGLS